MKWMPILFASILSVVAFQPAEADVEIIRDEWGVPHIYAATEEAGYYGLGYAQAEDRLENILGTLMWSKGRAASLLGKSMLDSDLGMLKWQHEKEGIRGVARLSPQLKRNYEYYIRGIKAYMNEHSDEVPVWAPSDISVADILTLVRAFFWGSYQSSVGTAECFQGASDNIPKLEKNHPKGASNEWAVSASKTSGGSVILLADPHAGVDNPAYYEYHMEVGDLHSAGYSVGPMLWQAHNENLGWALTTGAPDVVDCYEVTVDPNNPNRFLFDGKWQKMEQRDVTVKVAGQQPVEAQFQYTRHNGLLSPVVARSKGKAYVVSSAYMQYAGVMHEEFYRMNKAGSMAALKAALKTVGMLPQNLLASDVDGNIYFARLGRTPVRDDHYDWSGPVPGNTSRTEWKGFHSLEDLIQFDNPEQGYVQNNNVAPDRMFEAGNIIQKKAYPSYIFNDVKGRITSRGVRSNEVLSKAKSFSFEDAQKHATDEKWTTTDAWQEALNYALKRRHNVIAQKSEGFRKFLYKLLEFDGFAKADSVAAANFYFWRLDMASALPAPALSYLNNFPWQEQDFTDELADILIAKAEEAMAFMKAQYGTTEIKLGDIFVVGPKGYEEPLGGGSISSKGVENCFGINSPFCDVTLRAFRSTPIGDSGKWRAVRGTQALRLMEFSKPIKSVSMRLYGQSKKITSKHYADQVKLSSTKTFKKNYFIRSDVLGHAITKTTLMIKPVKLKE